MGKRHYMQEHMGNISKEMHSLRKNKKEMLEIKKYHNRNFLKNALIGSPVDWTKQKRE